MAKTKVSDWSATAGNNLDIGNINIAEGCPAGNMNNAFRELMAQVATLNPVGLGDANLAYQAINPNLSSLAGLTLAADRGLYSTAANTLALFTLTAAGRALLDDANAAAQRTTLGLGTAATRAAEDTLTDGSNLPDGAAVKAYVDAEVGAISWVDLGLTSLSGGTVFDFTSFPSTVTEIEIDFLDASLSGTDDALVQLRASGLISTGYVSSSTVVGRFTNTSTAGFIIGGNSAARATLGRIRLSKFSSAGWIATHQGYESLESFTLVGAGKVTGLAADVDGVRFGRTGTNTFDGGTIKVRYR